MSGRVVVVGSVNVDLVVRGERLPAPGETVTGGTFERHHGGKGGNQAVAAARLGRPTFLIAARRRRRLRGRGSLGARRRRRRCLRARDDPGRSRPASRSSSSTPRARTCISVASGANHRLAAAAIARGLRPARVARRATSCSSAGRSRTTAVAEALGAARRAGATTVLNPAPADGISAADLHLVDVLTPNRGELAALRGWSPADDDADRRARPAADRRPASAGPSS